MVDQILPINLIVETSINRGNGIKCGRSNATTSDRLRIGKGYWFKKQKCLFALRNNQVHILKL